MKSSSIEILMILRFDGSEVKIRVRISQISAGFSWRWSSEMMVIYGDGDSVELPSTINYHKLPLLKRKPSRCGPGQFRGTSFRLIFDHSPDAFRVKSPPRLSQVLLR